MLQMYYADLLRDRLMNRVSRSWWSRLMHCAGHVMTTSPPDPPWPRSRHANRRSTVRAVHRHRPADAGDLHLPVGADADHQLLHWEAWLEERIRAEPTTGNITEASSTAPGSQREVSDPTAGSTIFSFAVSVTEKTDFIKGLGYPRRHAASGGAPGSMQHVFLSSISDTSCFAPNVSRHSPGSSTTAPPPTGSMGQL